MSEAAVSLADEFAHLRGRVAALEAELATNRAALEDAGRLRSDFFSTMSHELRTPLNAIIGFSEMMKDGIAGPLSPKQAEFINHVFRAGNHLLQLIDGIMDLSKLDAGRLRLEMEEVELDLLVDAVVSAEAERAAAKSISIVRDETSESIRLVCDPRRVRQILTLLVCDGIAAAKRGSSTTIGVRAVSRRRIDSELVDCVLSGTVSPDFEAYVELSVEHQGRGLEPDELSRIFAPFGRGEREATKASETNGLGVALVSRLTAVHGGAAAASSQVDVGTRFAAFLPLRVKGFLG